MNFRAEQNITERANADLIAAPALLAEHTTLNHLDNSNVYYSGTKPQIKGGTPLQRSLGRGQVISPDGLDNTIEIGYQFIAINSELNFLSQKNCGDIKILSNRSVSVSGSLDIEVLESIKNLEIHECGSNGISNKTIVISESLPYHLKIILGEGANTPHFFKLHVNSQACGEYTMESSHTLHIEDSYSDGMRTISISRT